MMTIRLFVGRQQVVLPRRRCEPEDVARAASRLNPPFVVRTPRGGRFCTKKRVFLDAGGVRVECENDAELGFACRLLAEEHNLHYTTEEDPETGRMEAAALAHMQAPDSDEDEAPKEDEDISLQEWEQLGYKWFKREDVTYI